MKGIRQSRTRADLAASAFDLQRTRLSGSGRRMSARVDRRKPALLVGGGFLTGVLLMAPTRNAAQLVSRLSVLATTVLRSPLLNAVLIPVWQIAGPTWLRRGASKPAHAQAEPSPQSSEPFSG